MRQTNVQQKIWPKHTQTGYDLSCSKNHLLHKAYLWNLLKCIGFNCNLSSQKINKEIGEISKIEIEIINHHFAMSVIQQMSKTFLTTGLK